MNTNQITVVFSAWRATNDLIENMEASQAARKFLTDCGLAHWDAIGAYKEDGQDAFTQEVSHVVHCDAQDVLDLMVYAQEVHKQDCILVINSDGNTATLESQTSTVELGTLQQVTRQQAATNGAYTYFLGDYFICQ